VFIVLERAKSSILPNGNFREFFLWRGEFCVFKTGIPGGPGLDRSSQRVDRSGQTHSEHFLEDLDQIWVKCRLR